MITASENMGDGSNIRLGFALGSVWVGRHLCPVRSGGSAVHSPREQSWPEETVSSMAPSLRGAPLDIGWSPHPEFDSHLGASTIRAEP